MEAEDSYLSVEQAARQLGVTPGQVRRALRQFGLGDLLRASMRKQVLIKRTDLAKLRAVLPGSAASGRGAA